MFRSLTLLLAISTLLFSGCAVGSPFMDDTMPTFPLPEPDYTNKRIRDLRPYDDALAAFSAERTRELDALLLAATIPHIQALFASDDLTSVELVTYYVDRIRRYDIDKLNAVMELNPAALDLAAAADAARAAGEVTGPMHGIPVLLKDNIATGDRMRATAGAYALKDWQPERDAFLVQQLRDAGAIILGKANLSEWANYMDPSMPNGFSVLGGQTRHPYGPFDPLGSSSGSAVAAAANLATVTVGSETQGSIISPAKVNSVVGLKTSYGLDSGDYIIPLVDWMDVAGPIGRNVTDVAVLLTAMTGVDAGRETDPALAAAQATDFAQFASLEAAEGLTIGVPVFDDAYVEGQVRSLAEMDIEVTEELRQSLQADAGSRNEQMRTIGEMLTAAGLETVEVSAAGLPADAPILEILEVGFQDSFNQFAASADAGFPVAQLADVAELNGEDPANRAPYGQSFVLGSAATEQSAEEYATLRERVRQEAAAAFRTMLTDGGADVLLISDLSRDITQEYAAAGFPALTVPMGYSDDGAPIGILLMADYLGEPDLIAAGYAIEQATLARRAPDLDAVTAAIEALGNE